MKYLLTFLILFSAVAAVAQVSTTIEWTRQTSLPADETIYYDANKKLHWENFKGTPQNRGIVAAVTFSGFGYKADIKTVNGKSQLNIKLYCYFNKNKSWVKPGKTTPYILQHEQHHFDISYIAACIFADRVQGTVFSPGTINATLPKIYQECVNAMDKMQDEYDDQTKNGMEKEKQAEWDAKINLMLKQLSAQSPS